MAVGDDGNAFAYDGNNWTSLTRWSNPIEQGQPSLALMWVSCVASNYFLTVDTFGDAFSYNGRTWASVPGLGNNSSSGSCLSGPWCVAVGPEGAWSFDGSA